MIAAARALPFSILGVMVLMSLGRADIAVANDRQQDVEFLIEELPKRHPNLFDTVAREDFELAAKHLRELDDVSENQWITELMRFATLPSAKGKNGHTGIWPLQEATGFRILPIQLYAFEEGIFIVATLNEHENLVGARLVSVGGVAIDKAVEAVRPLIFRDNEMGVLRFAPTFLRIPELLQGIGLIQDVERVQLDLEERKTGAAKENAPERLQISLAPVALADYLRQLTYLTLLPAPHAKPELLYLSNPASAFWYQYLAEERTLYMQYNEVVAKNPQGGRLKAFCRDLAGVIDREPVERLVVDLRLNSGGDNTTYSPLLELLQESETERKIKLFLVIGRGTFSAAGNFVTDVERTTQAILVGEPTAGGPNQYGDAKILRLSNSGLEVAIPTRYWEKGGPSDTRLTHEPNLWVKPTAEAYFAGEDEALAAILSSAE